MNKEKQEKQELANKALNEALPEIEKEEEEKALTSQKEEENKAIDEIVKELYDNPIDEKRTEKDYKLYRIKRKVPFKKVL